MPQFIAKPKTVGDIIEEYEEKFTAVESEIENFNLAFESLQMASTVMGCYVDPVGSRSYLNAQSIRKNLLISGWKAVYNRLDVARIATAKDKKLFDQTLASPPPLTMDTAKATFGDYLIRPRFHILRGLAEVFAGLDPAYRSHSKVRIGVKGLPKRIILNGWGEYSSGWARDRFRDIVNALAAYQGIEHFAHVEFSAISVMHDKDEDAVLNGDSVSRADRYGKIEIFATVDRGMSIRKFGNGNAHVYFTPATLLDINRALAEFYGEVLPDAEPEGVKPNGSTAVSKDLQFYPTPRAVIDEAMEYAHIPNPAHYRGDCPRLRILEPSCGDGRIMDALRQRKQDAFGIEYHPGRAAEARSKGNSVLTANFLEHPATPEFDVVLMNPPFYGTHWRKHVDHALKFLKPGGTLVSILPATARYDHDAEGDWEDLPVASFADSGTNIPAGLLRIIKR